MLLKNRVIRRTDFKIPAKKKEKLLAFFKYVFMKYIRTVFLDICF